MIACVAGAGCNEAGRPRVNKLVNQQRVVFWCRYIGHSSDRAPRTRKCDDRGSTLLRPAYRVQVCWNVGPGCRLRRICCVDLLRCIAPATRSTNSAIERTPRRTDAVVALFPWGRLFCAFICSVSPAVHRRRVPSSMGSPICARLQRQYGGA